MVIDPPEIPLEGGRITSSVVRVGNTVRRARSAASPFMARLLSYLEACGCAVVPRYFGTDSKGRDVLEFIEGSVPPKFRCFEDKQVAAAARLLRAFHDATRGTDLAHPQLVICHHDPGPNNTVFRDEVPCAFIDLDMAAPGHPLEDVGYMAWTWCISSKPSRGLVATQAAQVRVVADSYGLDAGERKALMPAVMERLLRNKRFWDRHAAANDLPNTTPEAMLERAAWSIQELQYVESNLVAFENALCP